ncbi:ATP-grasp domain-containing protein [Streptomyces sp. 8N706]
MATLSTSRPPRGRRYFDHVLHGDPFDPASALAAVVEFEKRTGLTPAAVVPFVDPSLGAGLAVAEYYGLPFLSADAVRHSSVNKDLMKSRLQEHGIPTPRHVPFHDAEGLRAAIAQVGLPCVIKPSGFGGSMGVTLITDESRIEDRCAYVMRTFAENYADFSITNHSLQAEEYCDLPYEVSVEVMNHGQERRVLAVTDKSLGPAPYFAEMGHRVPSVHAGDQEIRKLALRACAAVGIDRGIAHVEIRLDGAGRMEVIEIAARTGGDGILDLVERVHGVAPYELHIRSYLDDLDTIPAPQPPAGTAALAVLKARAGRIREVAPFPATDAPVVAYDIFAAPGDRSGDPECYEQREGYVVLHWPAAEPHTLAAGLHCEIAADIARTVFQVEE